MSCQPESFFDTDLSGGVELQYPDHHGEHGQAAQAVIATFFEGLELQDAVVIVQVQTRCDTVFRCHLKIDIAQSWVPGYNTLEIPRRWTPLHQKHASADTRLDREIMVALLASPVPFVFADLDALMSAVRTRRFMVEAACKTALAFNTAAAERPDAFWRYDEQCGFILQPGQNLISALISATQPEVTGQLYDFSCYRATEYVILLGIAQEAQISNPSLFQALQQRNEIHAIRSGLFHDVFLVEYGSMEQPLPSRYYVPGDRLWFRNPDERSSDITGYEGSWVIYTGNGLFSNFWQKGKPYTLIHKCVEIYHWRDGAYKDANGELQMDEMRVEALVEQTLKDPVALSRVLELMMRLREPRGVYIKGGCIDTTREHPKQISAHSCDLKLPPWPEVSANVSR